MSSPATESPATNTQPPTSSPHSHTRPRFLEILPAITTATTPDNTGQNSTNENPTSDPLLVAPAPDQAHHHNQPQSPADNGGFEAKKAVDDEEVSPTMSMDSPTSLRFLELAPVLGVEVSGALA